LTETRDATVPDVLGLALEGRAVLSEARLQSAELKFAFNTPGTEDLLRIPALKSLLSEPLSKLSPLDGLSGAVNGKFHLEPELSFDAVLGVYKNSWLDTVHAAIAYNNKVLAIDDLKISAPGLDVSASADIPSSGGSASARLNINGSDWLTRVVIGASLPDSTVIDIAIKADDLAGAPVTNISLNGKAAIAGNIIDKIDVTASVPIDLDVPSDINLLITAFGTSFSTHVQMHNSPVIEAELTKSTTYHGENVLSGGVSYDIQDRSVAINDLKLSGSLGDHTINASLDSLQQGSFDAAFQWPEPPPMLLDKLQADSAALAEVDSAWRADGPFGLRIDGTLARRVGGDIPEVSATAQLRLPGPRNLAPLVGADVAVDDLGPIEGSLQFTTGSCTPKSPSYDARLDLGSTSWLDTALVDVTTCATSIDIDSVLIVFDNLRLAANGRSERDELDLHARLELADSLLLTRFLPVSQVPSVSLDAAVHLAGTHDAPRVAAAVEASYSTANLKVPHIIGTANLVEDSLYASIELPRRLHAYGVVMDSMSLTHSGVVGDSLSGRTSFTARGPDTYTLYEMNWVKNGGVTIQGDTLYFTMMNRDLVSTHPFQLSVSPGGDVRIDGLELMGSIGLVMADGYTSPDSADFNAEIIIHAPRKPGFLEIADRLWPDSLIINANVDGPTQYHIGAVVDGIEIAGETPVSARLELRSNPASTSASAAIDSPDRRLFEITGYLPAYHLGDKLGEGPVELDVYIDRLPVPADYQSMTQDKPEILGWLDGRVAVRGTASDPSAVGALRCEFAAGASGYELAEYRLDVEGQLRGRAAMDTALVRIGRDWFYTGPPDPGAPQGLTASLSMTKSGRPVLDGELMYPIAISLAPLSVQIFGDSDMNLEFKTGEVALTDFDPLLPPDIDLEGTCNVTFSATGRADNPSLSVGISTWDVKILSARGAQITPEIQVDLGGTAARPSVTGKITIKSGFIRVPEQQSQLHPSEGVSLLWETADSAATAAATTGAGPLEALPDSLDIPELDSGLDLDVRVEIPGSFRIIGSRMNVELSGDLHLVQRGESTVLTGELIALSGQLLFVGRTFELRRGNVNFYGGDELNPSLDLTLVTEVSSYRIEIRLTGSLKDPELALTSDPQLAESDIMSLLVFGQQMDDLNTSQSGLVQQRTAELLMVYGAVKLQEQMSQQMGVDIITIQQSTRKPDESALVVGKYLNSRTLIRYEQNLENTGAFLINLEYILPWWGLKLETYVDQASATGVELNWSKDY
jgi:hypothetical protein